MRVTRCLAVFGLIALFSALALWGWLALPLIRHSTDGHLAPSQMSLGPAQALAGTWQLSVTAPERVPLGESGRISLVLTGASAEEAPSGSGGHGEYSIVAEARAEVPAAGVSPSGISSQALSSGSTAKFQWQVRPQGEGKLEGRVWLYLRFVPNDGGEGFERPVTLQEVAIQSITLFGRSATQIRSLSSMLLGIGLGLCAPYLVLRFRGAKFRDL